MTSVMLGFKDDECMLGFKDDEYELGFKNNECSLFSIIMVFSSNIFLFAFLPLVLALYFATPNQIKLRNIFLLIASLIFYSWGELHYLFLLLISISANYFFGIVLEKNKKFISLAIAFNLLILGYYKYANFLIENLNSLGLNIENKKISLPIGISFFTFHAISYLIDIYRKKCRAQKSFIDLALYIAFFPQLIAGPIVRYNFIAKYLNKRNHNYVAAAYGIRRFIIGLGKKVIIANPLGEVADAVFNSPLHEINAGIAWFGLLCYTLQIYFDFSGYSDMAIGLARIFGFKFPENFNYPYISRSIKEFWRRWHISLSAWFRDYVYIPLGGNRCSIKRQYFNLVLVFFLCGLWHGASWNFIIWGLFHGIFLVLERIKKFDKILNSLPKILQNFYVVFLIMIGWVFFRSPDLSHSANFLKIMFLGNEIEEISTHMGRLINSHFTIFALSLAFLGLSPFLKNLTTKLKQKNKSFKIALDVFLILVLIFVAIRISASTYNPFIYFQF